MFVTRTTLMAHREARAVAHTRRKVINKGGKENETSPNEIATLMALRRTASDAIDAVDCSTVGSAVMIHAI
jgi:hypothetical protein